MRTTKALFCRGIIMATKVKLKKALTVEEQLKHLKNKKLQIDNEGNALKVLRNENYYRLSGYWINFLDDHDEFYPYITFEKIYKIYNFDKTFRGILLELINDVEVYFKTRLANYFSLKYGSDGYLDFRNFKSDSYLAHKALISKIDSLKNSNPNNLIVKHHKNNYGDVMPLWVVVELLSLGNISKLFSMMKNEDKNEFVKEAYCNISYKYIESFYHGVTYFRNQCCHFQRLYDVNHTIKVTSYKTRFSGSIDNRTSYYYVFILMMLNPNQLLGQRTIFRLLSDFKKSKIDKYKYGFSYNWLDVLKKANGYCIKDESLIRQ